MFDCTGAALCDGFDDRTNPKAGLWGDVGISAGSSMSITTDYPRSGTGALRLAIDPKVNASSFLLQQLNAATKVELSYAVYSDVLPRHSNMMGIKF